MSIPDVVAAEPLALRELRAVREIAHAFLVADAPGDVYQFALNRVTPLLGAAFSLIMQLGEDGELLRPIAQYEWPAKHRHWIGALRVRVGDGPSGVAVAERRVVEIADLFAEPSLQLWYEVAEELGFRSIVAAPLIGARGPVGAIAFYFTDATQVTAEQGALVRLVADQLAATADKSVLIDELRRANAALAEANAEYESQAALLAARQHANNEFVETLTSALTSALQDSSTRHDPLAGAAAISRAARELVAFERGTVELNESDTDPRAPLLAAVQYWRSRTRDVPMLIGEPTVLLPTMRTDVSWLTRVLELVLGLAVAEGGTADALVHADVELGRGFVAHRVRWRARKADDAMHHNDPAITPFDWPLAHAIANRLGGELQRDDVDASDADRGLTLIFPMEFAE